MQCRPHPPLPHLPRIKNGTILTKYPTLPFSPNKCNILFILEPFQGTAPDTSGHVTWQAEVSVTQNEQQDGTGEVRRINS